MSKETVYTIGAIHKSGISKSNKEYNFYQLSVLVPRHGKNSLGYYSKDLFCNKEVYDSLSKLNLPKKIAIEINPFSVNQNITDFDEVVKQ